MSWFKIDPISLNGFDNYVKALKKGTVEAAKESAEQLKDIVEHNIRTGYEDPVLGLGYEWTPLSPERAWVLQMKGLVPHTGLVAETEKLVDSLAIDAVGDEFKVTVGRGIEYAWTHEYGGGRGQVPPRPYFHPAILHFKTEGIPKTTLEINLKAIRQEAV